MFVTPLLPLGKPVAASPGILHESITEGCLLLLKGLPFGLETIILALLKSIVFLKLL